MMRGVSRSRFEEVPLGWVVAAAVVGCFCGEQAGAQQAAGSSAPTRASAQEPQDSGGLQEIIVTANKRSESIQKVPIAITAVTADRLNDVGITDTQDLAEVVPGLTIQSGIGGTQAHLRGVGTTAVGAGTENSVATYVDNVYILSMSGALVQLNNISQIEVLKGPQGTLFGRNATGGVVSIRTRDPQQTLGGDISMRYGNYNTVSMQGYLTGGLTEKLSADIAAFASVQRDGWGRNLVNGDEANKLNEYAVRSKWLFEPTDNDQFRFIADYSLDQGDTLSNQTALRGTAVNYGLGNTLAAQRPDLLPFIGPALAPFAVVGDPYVRQGGFYDINSAVRPSVRFDTEGVSLQWNHNWDQLRFTSITAYRRSRQNVLFASIPAPADRANATFQLAGKQFSQELQLGSATESRVQWVAGLYYLYGTSGYPVFAIRGTSLAPLDSLNFLVDQSTRSGAAFGQVTVPMWSGAHLTGGLRYTVEQRGVEGETIAILPPAFGGASLVSGQTNDQKTFSKPTWRIAVDQQVTPEVLAYVSYNRGFKSGQFNSIPPSNTIVNPEVLDAYELGLKTDLFDRRVRLNVAGFYYDYKDLQVTVYKTVAAVLQNGAGAKIYGGDIDLTAKMGSHLTLNGGATLMTSKFTSYPDAPFLVPQPASAGGGTLQNVQSAKGNRIPYAPDTTFNLGANYTVPVGAGQASFNVSYSYSSRWYSGGDNILSQPSYGLLDASLNYKFSGDHVEVGLWGRNITDEKYFLFLIAGANPGGYQEGVGAAPRTFGARVGYHF